MTKRIFQSICIAAVTVLLASLVPLMGALYDYFSRVPREQPSPQADAAAGDNLPVSTALMRFLSAVTESGDVCRSITTMTAGYLHSTSFTDPVRLSPVWFITTDTASYYLDAATGDLTRLT